MHLTTVKTRLNHIPEDRYPEVGRLILNFLDTVETASPRASFYNTEDETVEAVNALHREVFNLDRGIYTIMLGLPGAMDWGRQLGVTNLLNTRVDGSPAFLTPEQETRAIQWLTNRLPITRRLKLFVGLKEKRVNNARTRKLILRSVLNDEDLEWHAVKYRSKLRDSLIHAWGERMTGILRSILEKDTRTDKEKGIYRDHVDRYLDVSAPENIKDCLRFILGSDQVTTPLFQSYYAADEDFSVLQDLPPEVAEGKRATFHPEKDVSLVLEQTKDKMTETQAMRSERSAERRGIEVEWDPNRQEMVNLYVYALERGITEEIRQALNDKAEQIAQRLPFQYTAVGIVIDTSKSMIGHRTQKYRPLAVSLAVRDVLEHMTTGSVDVAYTGGEINGHNLPQPKGHTELAQGLLEVMREDRDAVFILTDGYENVTAGRVAEVIGHLRKMGVTTPIFQITPTFSAEAFGAKMLSNQAPILTVGNKIEALGTGMVKAALETDLMRGIQALINTVAPLLLPEVEND